MLLTSSLTSAILSSASFEPAMAALAFMSALTIDPSTIFALVTVLSLGVPILTVAPIVTIK